MFEPATQDSLPDAMTRSALASDFHGHAHAKHLDRHFEPNVVNINKYLGKHQQHPGDPSAGDDSFDSGDIWRNEKSNWLRGRQQQPLPPPVAGGATEEWLGQHPGTFYNDF